MANNETGVWSPLEPWPFIGMHATVLPDGKVLTFGLPKEGYGKIFYHDVYDPVTGTHQTMSHQHTQNDLVCSSSILIPGTDQVLMVGGRLDGENATVNATLYDQSANSMADATSSYYGRWYATTISLPTGQILVLGGDRELHQGNPIPEIYTPGEGWHSLPGAFDIDMAWNGRPNPNDHAVTNGEPQYPQAWVAPDGKVVYYGNGKGYNGETEVYSLDPSGEGSITKIGSLPFAKNWDSPAIMFDTGKVLIMAENGDVWTMDINGVAPQFVQVGALPNKADWAGMVVLADGTVLITQGGSNGQSEAASDKAAIIWDPDSGQFTTMASEDVPRLYHAITVLLADGTVLSTGGTNAYPAGPGTNGGTAGFHPDMQIFRPPYLYDANGNLAVRPVISAAPTSIEPGDTFTITVDNAFLIEQLTFSKTGSATHSLNMDARFVELDFTVVNATTISVTVPANVNEVTAGHWMLFAWNDKGVPSIAPIIGVNPTVPAYEGPVDTGPLTDVSDANLLVNGDFEGVLAADSTTPNWRLLTNDQANGWISSNNRVEVWNDGFNGQAAASGRYVVQIDDANGSLSQIVKTEAGQSYELNFNYAGMTGGIGTSMVEVVWNGQVIETIVPPDASWKNYYFKVTGTGGNDVVTFRSVSVDKDSSGGLLNAVALRKIDAPTPPDPGSLLSNGSFETATGVVADSYSLLKNGQVGAWQSSTNQIEVWNNGFGGVTGTDGRNVVEIDAGNGTLSQQMKTEAGKSYDINFDFSGRPGAIASSTMEVLWNGQVIYTVTPADAAMKSYSFKVTGTGGNDTLAFRSPAGDTDSYGGLLDKVLVKPADANMAVNGSFESMSGGGMTMPMAHVMTNGQVPGWTSSANRIEMWMNGYNGVTGTDGKNIVEIDAQNGVLSQAIKTEAGKAYGITFDYAGQAGAIASSAMEVLWNGVVIATINPADAAFKNYHTHAFGTGGNDVLAFRAVAGDTDAIGGLLDKVVVAISGHAVSNPINGTAGDDYIVDTNADDVIKAGAGDDTVFLGSRGNDTVDGEAGNNHVDLDGAASDYTFGRDANGNVTVTSAATGTDTLMNINGFYFYGEERWYDLVALAPPANGSANTITGTAGDDYIVDTNANDVIKAGAGDDTVVLRNAGNDTVDGEGGNNHVDLEGAAANYTFGRDANGNVTVTSAATGTDTLMNMKGFYFYGEEKWYDLTTLAPPASGSTNTITGTAGDDYIVDTDANDVIKVGAGDDTVVLRNAGNDTVVGEGGNNHIDLEGAASDYTFGRDANGNATVSSAATGTDTLINMRGFYFYGEGKWYDLDALAPPSSATIAADPEPETHVHTDAFAHA